MPDLRAIITGLLVACLLVSHNLFLYCRETARIDSFDSKVWVNLELLLLISPIIWLGNHNDKSKKEIEFRKIATLVFSIIVGIIAIHNASFLPLLPSPRQQMYFFNGISLAIVLYGLLFTDKNGDL